MKQYLGETRHNIVEAGLSVTIPEIVPDRNQTLVVGMRHRDSKHTELCPRHVLQRIIGVVITSLCMGVTQADLFIESHA
jgi:hypothetical protein